MVISRYRGYHQVIRLGQLRSSSLRKVPSFLLQPMAFLTPTRLQRHPNHPRRTARRIAPRRVTTSSISLSHAIRIRATTTIPQLINRDIHKHCLTPTRWRAALAACLHDRQALEKVMTAGLSSSLAKSLHVSHFIRPLRNLADAGQWNAVFKALHSMTSVGPPVAPDERLLVNLANQAVERSAYMRSLQFFDFMRQNGVAMGPVSYSVLLKSHGRACNIVAVKQTLEDITSKGIIFDSVLLNSAVDAFIRCDDLTAASKLIDDTTFASLLNAASYNTIIKGFAAKGLVEDALSAVQRMRANGCEPNAVTRNTILSACIRAGDFDRAWSMIEKNSEIADDGASGQLTIALTSLVAGLAEAGRIGDAIDLLSDMTRRNAPPSPITYAALITACFGQGAIEDAVDVFRDIPDSLRTLVVCNAYVAGLCRVGELHRVEEAAELVESLMYGRTRPNEVTFNSLLDGFMRCGAFERAEHYLNAMESARVKPGIVSYTILMKGFGNARQFGKAKRMFRELSKRGLKPDRVALNAFVSICARSGDCVAAERVLAYMEREGGAISPDAYSYAPLIAALARARRDEELWKTYNRMRHSGIPVSEYVCELLCAYIAASDGDEDGAKRGADILRTARADGVTANILRKCRRKMVAALSDPKAKDHLRGLDGPDFRSASETIFERHGWNDIDSGWRVI